MTLPPVFFRDADDSARSARVPLQRVVDGQQNSHGRPIPAPTPTKSPGSDQGSLPLRPYASPVARLGRRLTISHQVGQVIPLASNRNIVRVIDIFEFCIVGTQDYSSRPQSADPIAQRLKQRVMVMQTPVAFTIRPDVLELENINTMMCEHMFKTAQYQIVGALNVYLQKVDRSDTRCLYNSHHRLARWR